MIGFHNMLRGFVTSRFRVIQELHYKKIENCPKGLSADKWIKKFIVIMHDFLLCNWKFRCDQIHSNDAGTMEVRTKSRAHLLLQTLRKKPWLILPEDKGLRTRKDFCKSTIQSIRNWLSRVEVSMVDQSCRKKVKRNGICKYLKKPCAI